MSKSPDTTQLLVEGRQGQKGAIDALMPRLHTELKLRCVGGCGHGPPAAETFHCGVV